MRLYHRDDEAMPETLRAAGVTTSRGDVVDVDADLADRLLDRRHLAAVDCPATTEDGEICGRERPCQYHDPDDYTVAVVDLDTVDFEDDAAAEEAGETVAEAEADVEIEPSTDNSDANADEE